MAEEIPELLNRTIALLAHRIVDGGSGYGFDVDEPGAGCGDAGRRAERLSEIADYLTGDGQLPHLTRLAVVASVHELLLISTADKLGEEHQTATLMGHLATNLSWYSLLYSILFRTRDIKSLSSVYWAAPNHKAEASLGADFAVISGSTPQKNEPLYRLKLFQAKREKRERVFSIDHTVKATETNPSGRNTPYDAPFLPLLKRVAQNKEAYTEEWRILIEDKHPFVRPGYQLEAFVRSHVSGNSRGRSNVDWCYYTPWPYPKQNKTAKEPLCYALTDVVQRVLNNGNPPKSYPATETGLPLIDLILGTIDPEAVAVSCPTASVSLLLNRVNLEELLPTMTNLLPGIEMVGVGDEGSSGGLISALSAAGYETIANTSLGSADPGPGLTHGHKP